MLSLRTLRGSWERVQDHTTVHSSDVIRTGQDVLSADSVPIMLSTGELGQIRHFDRDGDAHAYFPGLATKGVKTELILFAHDFKKLELMKTMA